MTTSVVTFAGKNETRLEMNERRCLRRSCMNDHPHPSGYHEKTLRFVYCFKAWLFKKLTKPQMPLLILKLNLYRLKSKQKTHINVF